MAHQVNIRWTGPPGLIVARRVPKGATVEAYTGLLEVSVFGPEARGGGEYIVTTRYAGRVEWVHSPGVTIPRGKVVARIWGDVPEQEGAVSAWEVARESNAKPTQAIPLPYALTTQTQSKSYRLCEPEIVYIAGQAENWKLDKGEMMRTIVYNWATRTHEEQAEAIRRFREAMKGAHNE